MPALACVALLLLQLVYSSREFRVIDSHGNAGSVEATQAPELVSVTDFIEPYDTRGDARCCCDSTATSDNTRRCKVFALLGAREAEGIQHCADLASQSWVQGRLTHYNRVGDERCRVPVDEENDVHREILSYFSPSNYCRDFSTDTALVRRAAYSEAEQVPVTCARGYQARFETTMCGFHDASTGVFLPVPECLPIPEFCQFQAHHFRPTKGDLVIVTGTGRVGQIEADFRDERPYVVRFGEEEISDWLGEDEVAWPEAPPTLTAATGETVSPRCESPGAIASGEVVCEGSGRFSPQPACRWDTAYCEAVERPYSGDLSVASAGLYEWADVTCGPGFAADAPRVHCGAGRAFNPEPRCAQTGSQAS